MINNFKKKYNRIKNSTSPASFTTTLLMLTVVVLLFNFNLEAFKAAASPLSVVGEGTPGYVPMWVISTMTLPTVTTTPASSVAQTLATSGGSVTSNGGDAVTVAGTVWGTTSGSSNIGQTVHSNWADYSAWADSMAVLIANTTYHVRAYATNSIGTAYGNDVSFTTPSSTAPTVSLSAAKGNINLGDSTTLNWTINNATTCNAVSTNGDWAGSIAPVNGSTSISPASTDTYTLSCTGQGGGPTSASTVVTVGGSPPPGSGVCTTHYNCSTGTDDVNTNKSNTSNWTWTCDGDNGTNTFCKELKKKPVYNEN